MSTTAVQLETRVLDMSSISTLAIIAASPAVLAQPDTAAPWMLTAVSVSSWRGQVSGRAGIRHRVGERHARS